MHFLDLRLVICFSIAQTGLAASAGIGDFVASGIGLARASPFSNTTTQATPSLPPTATSTGSTDNGSETENDCYDLWLTYWSASRSSKKASWSLVVSRDYSTSAINTTTYTSIYGYSAASAEASTFLDTVDTTKYSMNGGFTIATEIIHTTSTRVVTYPSHTASYSTVTVTRTYWTTLLGGNGSVPATPTCKLPSVVPQCQIDWEKWISTQLVPSPTPPPHCDINAGFLQNTNAVSPCVTSYASAWSSYNNLVGRYSQLLNSPICTPASIDDPLCQSIRDNYVHDGNIVFKPEEAEKAFFFSAGTLGFYNGMNTSWTWPTSSTLGVPSCTLGCGRCAVTGGTVRLIYWPATTTPAGNWSAHATGSPGLTPAGPLTVVTLGTTFTSPTYYISFKSVYASDACKGVGSTLSSTIIAIPASETLSSVYGGTIPCDAHFRPTQEWTATAPFTVADLNEPVPYSIYSSQPWCATYLRNEGCTGVCPTTAPYRPILVVADNVLQSMDPAWSTCYGDIRGLYDPPIALEAQASLDVPTIAVTTSATMTATPASSPSKPASQTFQPSAAEDKLPLSSGQANRQSQENSQPAQTQNVGGVLASILAGAPSTQPPGTPDPPTHSSIQRKPQQSSDPTSPQNAVDVLASALSGASSPPTAHGSTDPTPNSFAVPLNQSNGGNIDPSTQPAEPTPQQSRDPTAMQNAAGIPSAKPGGVSGAPAAQASASAASLGGQQVSVQSAGGGIVVGTGSAAKTLEIASSAPGEGRVSEVTVGGKIYTVVPQVSGSASVAVANGGASVTLGSAGAATTLGGQVVSAAAAGGVVVGTGTDAATVGAAHSRSGEQGAVASVVTAGGQIYTVFAGSGGSSGVVVANRGSTVTLTSASAVTTLGDQIVSAPQSGGAVIGSGSTAATVGPMQGSQGSALSESGAGETAREDSSTRSSVPAASVSVATMSFAVRALIPATGLCVVAVSVCFAFLF